MTFCCLTDESTLRLKFFNSRILITPKYQSNNGLSKYGIAQNYSKKSNLQLSFVPKKFRLISKPQTYYSPWFTHNYIKKWLIKSSFLKILFWQYDFYCDCGSGLPIHASYFCRRKQLFWVNSLKSWQIEIHSKLPKSQNLFMIWLITY